MLATLVSYLALVGIKHVLLPLSNGLADGIGLILLLEVSPLADVDRFQVQIFRLRQPQLIATRPLTCGYLRDSRKLSDSEPFDLLDFS